MATVSDLISGSSFGHDQNGYHAIRVFSVTGLTGNGYSRLKEALIASGVPLRGESHPDFDHLKADTIVATPWPDSNSKAKVSVTYKPWTSRRFVPDPTADPAVEVGASLQEVETNLDYEDNLITVKYQPPGATEEVEQVARVRKTVVVLNLRLSRREPNSPRDKAQEFTNKVNDNNWIGDPERSWLCKAIHGNSDDGGESYLVTYEFQRQLPNWDVYVAWVDPSTGQHPTDLEEDVGYKRVQIHETAHFGSLSLGNF